MSKLSVLKQTKRGEDGVEREEIVAVFLPTTGKVTLEGLANAIGVSIDLVRSIVEEKGIRVHKPSKRLVSKWIVDVEDFWKKT